VVKPSRRQLAQRGHGVVVGQESLRRADTHCHLELVRVDVDGDDTAGLREASALDARESDPAAPDDGDGRARLHAGRVLDRSDTRRNPAADDRHDVERRVVADLDRPRRGHDDSLGERGDAEVVVEDLVAAPPAGRAVEQDALNADGLRGELALPWPAREALAALPTLRNPREDDVVAWGERVDAGPDGGDDARALVAEHDRQRDVPVAAHDM